MDLDLGFISTLVRGGDESFRAAKKAGIDISVLQGPAILSWEFIEAHYKDYRSAPSEELFLAKSKLQLVDTSDGLSFYIEEIKKRALWNQLREAHESVGELLEKRDPKEAYNAVLEGLKKIREASLSTSRIESLFSVGEDVIEYYERLKSGERGILSPWPALNDVTLGFWPGDFALFVARTNVGKTWGLLQLAEKAWMEGKKVLFIGTEMARLKLALRFYSLHFKLPFNELREGKLDLFKEKKLKDGVNDLFNESGIDIMGNDFTSKMTDIEAAIDEVNPDIVFIDGIALVKNVGRDRHEMVSVTADDSKRIAKSREIPIIASHQLNREAARKNPRDIGLENVAMSDVVVHNSDYIVAMIALVEEREDKIMRWKFLKVREGRPKPFVTKWDFDNMDFEQIEETGESDFGDDDYNSSPRPEAVEDTFDDKGKEEGDDGWFF